MKQKMKLVMATLFLLMTMTVYVFAVPAMACKDCGSVEHCDSGNNLNSGYRDCIIYWTNGVIKCQPLGWGGCSASA